MRTNRHESVFVNLDPSEQFDVDIPGRDGKTPTRVRIIQVSASRSDVTPEWGIGGAGFRVNKSTGELAGDPQRRTYRSVSRHDMHADLVAAALPLPVRAALREQGVDLEQAGCSL
jgi:hypothetical protein